MTYKVEETIAGNIISGPYEFVEEDGPFEGEKYGVTVPGSLYSTGTFDCAVYLKNTSAEDVTVMLYGLAGAFTIKDLVVPADGEFHLCTGTGSMGYDPGGDWDIAVKNNDYNSIDCIEMGTLTLYEEGGAPIVSNVLKNAAVTEIESEGKNLAVCTEGNAQEAYGITITRREGKSSVLLNGAITTDYAARLFGYFCLPVGTYTASVVGLNASDRLYVGAGNDVLVNYVQTGEPKTFTVSVEKECFFQIVFANGSTYSNTEIRAQIEKGSAATEFAPYAKHSLAIPEEVQALEGWGWGTDAKNYNRLVWDVSGGVKHYRQEVSSIDLGALSWTAQANNVFYGSFAMIAPPAAYPERMRGVLVADYANSTAQSIADMPDKSILRFEWGVAIRDTAYTDAAAFKEAMNGKTMLYARKDPVVTDLPTVLGDDNFIQVEWGGTITAINENNYDVPYTINYYTADKIDTVYTGKFIGQAVGEFVGDIKASFMVLSSPNGSRFKITIDDSGQLSTTKL